MAFDKVKNNPSPWNNASCISKLFFWWVIPLLKRGRHGDLKLSDIYDCPPVDSSDKCRDKLWKEWQKELEKQSEGKSPSLIWASIRCFGPDYCCNSLNVLLDDCVNQVVQPILLGMMIQQFSNMSEDGEMNLYLYTAIMCAFLIVFVINRHRVFFHNFRIGMRLRIACGSLIYRKALRLSQSSLGATTVGQMVNLLSNDVSRFDQSIVLFPYLIVGPVQTLIITAVLWTHLGYATLAGIAVVVLCIPFQAMMGKLFSKFRLKTALLTDERIRLMNEIIGGMRVIKIYGWEFPFADLADSARKKELSKIQWTSFLRGINLTVFFISSKIILLAAFAVFVVGVKGDLTPEKVFVSIALYNSLRNTMTFFFPFAISNGAETAISLKRLQKFLLLEERQKTSNLMMSVVRPEAHDCCVCLQKVVATWSTNKTATLKNITFSVRSGELLAVVGHVGSGKTSLLMSLLGELPIQSGEGEVKGRVAYASQEPWVFGGSVQQNILFGSPLDDEKYKNVINVCALDGDIELFANGDQTMVGERGVTLSGGQRARVNLARAVYFDADIFLLDDPLSAVDASVSKHLFEKCINGYLKDKVRILATHQVQFLKEASRVLVLKEGQCLALGTYEELLQNGIDLGSILEDYQEERRPRVLSTTSNISIKEDLCDPVTCPSYQRLCSTTSTISNRSFDEDLRDGPAYLHRQKSRSRSAASNNLNKIDDDKIENKCPEEMKSSGSVRFEVYSGYLRAGANLFVQTILFLCFASTQLLFNGSDFWLTAWTSLEQQKYNIRSCWFNFNESFLITTELNNSNPSLIDNAILNGNVSDECLVWTDNYKIDAEQADLQANTVFNLFIYAGLVGILFVLTLLRTTLYFYVCMKASRKLHDRMFRSILRSPVAFFDSNPVGRVLNRFSRDVGTIDETLPLAALDTVIIFLSLIGIICIVTIVEPYLLIATFVVTVAFIFIRRFYIPASRDIKRYEGIARSPVFSHLSNTLHGLTTIRAFKAQNPFEVMFDRHQDRHTGTWFMFLSVTRWLGITLEWLTIAYITCVTVSMVALSKTDNSYASKAGLVIVSALQLCGSFQWGVRQSTEVENQMTSVERVIDYSKLESEADLDSKKDKKPPKNWPNKGSIEYQNVSLRYALDDPFVLKNLNFKIKPEEKIGIVGRTGAGKSSVISTLFRMSEPEGKVIIDSCCINDIGLHDLRKKISIIPQDPVLFTGPVRRNLDPFQEHIDDELWQALDEAYLKETIKEMEAGLDAQVTEGGGNFSVGQRQLICLARAILRRNNILVLDEATANVDPNTDNLIQQTIRDRFKHCTVLTIAHRLHTIMDSDRVLVLDAGKVKEFDEPYKLLQNPRNQFSEMVQMTGPSMAHQLKSIAKVAHIRRMDRE